MNLYISVHEAADIAGVQTFAIYAIIRRKVLKARRIQGKLHTTREWLQDFLDHKDSRQLHSTYNGRKVFDEKRGEYSTITAAKSLNVDVKRLYYFMMLGKAQPYYKGQYAIFTAEEIERIRQEGTIYKDNRLLESNKENFA